MKKISLLIFMAFGLSSACNSNHMSICKDGEIALRSGICVTDCGCYLKKNSRTGEMNGQARFSACVKNQLGSGEHNYYAEIPSDCFDCKLARAWKQKSQNRGRKNGSSK